MSCGLDAVNAASSMKALFRPLSPAEERAPGRSPIDALANRIEDFCDADDFVKLQSMERTDYNAAKLCGLPRNGPLRFKEELALIPGIGEFLPEPEDGLFDYFRPIAPQGLPQAAGKPSFMCAKPLLLERLCRLSPKELELALAARKAWQENKIELKDSLDPSLLQKLKGPFSFGESGFYTLEIKSMGSGNPPGNLLISLRVEKQISGTGIVYYEYFQF
jgi:hypothetical protein